MLIKSKKLLCFWNDKYLNKLTIDHERNNAFESGCTEPSKSVAAIISKKYVNIFVTIVPCMCRQMTNTVVSFPHTFDHDNVKIKIMRNLPKIICNLAVKVIYFAFIVYMISSFIFSFDDESRSKRNWHEWIKASNRGRTSIDYTRSIKQVVCAHSAEKYNFKPIQSFSKLGQWVSHDRQ